MKETLILIIFFFVLSKGLSQDKHNFLVPPENTSCDSIAIAGSDIDTAVQIIANTSFRFQQNVSINRETGFREASYYSCDNQIGYMLIKYHDCMLLYSSLPITIWESMIKSGNPGDYFEKNIRDIYSVWLSKNFKVPGSPN